jgi:hypothetical protein
MSSKEIPGAQDDMRDTPAGLEHEGEGGGDNNVAQKLSHELDKWRRQRNGGTRPRRPESGNGATQQASGPARTIKVRGHETLVVRRSKLPPKPEADSASDKN